MEISVKIINIFNIDNNDLDIIKSKMPIRYSEINNIKNENVKKTKLATLLHMINNLNCSEEDIIYNKYNKPMLKNNNKYFNISNASDISLYVEDDYEIGIDIEEIDEKNIDIKNYAFNENEILYIDKNEIDNIHLLWTRKEAFVKMLGTGFIEKPSDLKVGFCIKGELNDVVNFNGDIYYLITKKYKNYYISICSKHKYDSIKIIY